MRQQFQRSPECGVSIEKYVRGKDSLVKKLLMTSLYKSIILNVCLCEIHQCVHYKQFYNPIKYRKKNKTTWLFTI